MKELIINHFLDYEFVYIFLFCSFLFLFISIFINKQIIRKISLLCFSVFFILFVFEFVLSCFMPLPIMISKEQINSSTDVHKIKFLKHSRFYSNDTIHEFYDKDVNVDIDSSDFLTVYQRKYSMYSNDFRVTKCNPNSDEVYVFLGCSFVFGIGLQDSETSPYYFSEKFNFEKNIINCGVVAKSANTALNILNNEKFSPLIKNKNTQIKSFVYTFIYDQLVRNFNYEDYKYRIDGYLYKNGKRYIPTTIGKVKNIFARSYIFRKVFVPMIDEKFEQYYKDYMIKSLKQINKIVTEKYNSKLTIIVWPEFDEDFDKKFIDDLKTSNLDVIFLPGYFNSEEEGYRIKYDRHPTAKANKEIAEILYNHMNEKDKTN